MDFNRLEKLTKLRDMGALTEEEFQDEKSRMMDRDERSYTVNDKKFGLDDDTFNMVLHLSQFCSFVVPVLGVAAPLALWLMNKNEDPIVDEHGRNILNWILSAYIYLFACGLLMFVLIGFLVIWIPIVLGVLFPIIGALKAKEGEVWKYPFSIPFF